MARIEIQPLARPEEQELTAGQAGQVVGAGPYWYGYGVVPAPYGPVLNTYQWNPWGGIPYRAWGGATVIGGGYGFGPVGVTTFPYGPVGPYGFVAPGARIIGFGW